MLYPIIKVKDTDGREHIVGENIHDRLYIDDNGALQYLNSQGCVGTGCPEEGYTFVGVCGDDEGSLTGRPEIEFVTLDQLIEMATEHLEKTTKNKIDLYHMIRADMEELFRKTEEETGIRSSGGGMLP